MNVAKVALKLITSLMWNENWIQICFWCIAIEFWSLYLALTDKTDTCVLSLQGWPKVYIYVRYNYARYYSAFVWKIFLARQRHASDEPFLSHFNNNWIRSFSSPTNGPARVNLLFCQTCVRPVIQTHRWLHFNVKHWNCRIVISISKVIPIIHW